MGSRRSALFSVGQVMSMRALALCLPLLLATGASAALGGHEDSVEADTTTMKAAHVKSAGVGYTVHEVKTSTTTVHEYANASGQIFAVTWQGMVRPDLKVLFGDYYEEYDQASAKIKRGKGRQFTTVTTDHIKVSRGGHMRDLRGNAYVPSLVPQNVNAEALQ